MKRLWSIGLAFLFACPALGDNVELQPEMKAAERVKVAPDHRYSWYQKQYPYMTMKDSVYSAESEFEWPKGFVRYPEKKLTKFQNWIAHLPLWHSQRAVGTQFSGFRFSPDGIARPIHLVRFKTRFSDKAIVMHLWGQFLEANKRQQQLVVTPTFGDTLRYENYLNGALAFGPRGNAIFTKAAGRKPTHDEFFDFVELCDQQVNYKSLAENCRPVSPDSILPGDMYITYNGSGEKGKVLFFVTLLVDQAGNKLFTVGQGCDTECDFYIPLVNGEKNFPWVGIEQAVGMISPMEHAGYYRPRLK